MKNSLVGSAVLALAINVQAQELTHSGVVHGLVTSDGKAVQLDQQVAKKGRTVQELPWQEAGTGGLAGAIVAGPPGFVLGVVGGALAGYSHRLGTDSAALQEKLQQAERALSLVNKQQQRLQRQLLEQSKANRQIQRASREQLEAIAAGVSLHFHYRTGSSLLPEHYAPALDQLVGMLGRLPGLVLQLHAGADRRGGGALNQVLSQQRVERLRQELVGRGVDPKHIRLKAHGEQLAIYPLNDIEGMAMDRWAVISFCLEEVQ